MTDANAGPALETIVTPFQRVDRGHFLFALFAAPLVVGLLGIPLVVPPFAVIMGYLPYLILGTPVFWAVLKVARTPGHRILGLVVAGFAVNFLSGPLYSVYEGRPLTSNEEITHLGMIFAPIWAGTLGLLYNHSTRRAARREACKPPADPPLGASMTPS